MANLKQKIAGGITLAGLVVGLGGCMDIIGYGLQNQGAKYALSDPARAQSYSNAAGLAFMTSQKEHEMNLAREGRTQIDINIDQNPQSSRLRYMKGRDHISGEERFFEIGPYTTLTPTNDIPGQYIINYPDGRKEIIDPIPYYIRYPDGSMKYIDPLKKP